MESTPFASAGPTDAELVHAAREGDARAFRNIVGRYQTLVCSVAYSGTGSFSRSEDIAQDTFVAAWRQLRDLREPGSLRSWLCGIARRLTSNAQRRAAHEPGDQGVAVDESLVSAELPTAELVMTAEEEALVWQALATIPETYREPLILFYRSHRSVAQVASDLQLSEDAAKQRLSRGRALLAERVLKVVEGALETTRPSSQFTAGVMIAVTGMGPMTGIGAASSGRVIATSTKIGTTSSGLGLLALPAALGAAVGWLMRPSRAQSEGERLSLLRMWQATVLVMVVVVLPIFALLALFGNHATMRLALTFWLALGYVAIGLPFAIWAWHNHLRSRRLAGRNDPVGFCRPFSATWFALLLVTTAVTWRCGFPSGGLTDIPLGFGYLLVVMPFAAPAWEAIERRRAPEQGRFRTVFWVAIGTVAMAALLGFSIFDMGGPRSIRLTPQQAREMATSRSDAKIYVLEYQDRNRTLTIVVPPSAGQPRQRYFAPLSDRDYTALKTDSIRFTVLRQGENFELLGTPGRLLFLLAAALVVAGSILLLWTAVERLKQRRQSAGLSMS